MNGRDGHRARLLKRFLDEGIDTFSQNTMLELLLFYAIPRCDTSPIAHLLLDTFGSLSGVFDAPIEELRALPGVGEHTAAFLHLMPQIARAYLADRTTEVCLDSTEKAGRYLLPRFVGRTEECVFVVCLDGKNRVLSTTLLFRGSLNAAEINLREVVSTALRHNAAGVVLAHNHPSGLGLPSSSDIETTARIRDALEPVGVRLIDHLIIADDDFVSLADSGYFLK